MQRLMASQGTEWQSTDSQTRYLYLPFKGVENTKEEETGRVKYPEDSKKGGGEECHFLGKT